MKQVLVIVVAVMLSLAALAPGAWANQPGQGQRSTGRNEAGFGGGPHCHVMATSRGTFEVRVFPSHTGHANAGNDIFNADADCDGAG